MSCSCIIEKEAIDAFAISQGQVMYSNSINKSMHTHSNLRFFHWPSGALRGHLLFPLIDLKNNPQVHDLAIEFLEIVDHLPLDFVGSLQMSNHRSQMMMCIY